MKKLLIIAALLSINIYAEQIAKASKEENIKKLSDLLYNKEQMAANMTAGIKSQQQFSPLALKDESVKKLSDKMLEKFNNPETIKAINSIFDKLYNDQEIEDMLKFYESTTGKKLIEKTGEMAVEIGQIFGKIIQEVMVELMAKPEAAKEEVKQ